LGSKLFTYSLLSSKIDPDWTSTFYYCINKKNDMRIIQFVLILLMTHFGVSCLQSKADKNVKLIKKIKVGMTEKQVRGIMGNPDKVGAYPFYDQEYNFLYEAPIGFSDDFRVFFSKNDSLVIRIGDGL
jgi:hypothetical protein